MQHLTSLQEVDIQGAWLTIGSFDGVHLGHRQILKKLTAGAHAIGAPAVVLTFFPHPAAVLRGPRDSFYLSTPEEKAALLGEAGVDVVITHPFNKEVSLITAQDFMAQLVEHLGVKQLWVGHDFAMGHDREGNVPRLRELGTEMGFEVQVVEAVMDDGTVVSSSLIRKLLLEGEVAAAARLLGRPYRLDGEVVRGDGRGRSIGIPTANLSIWRERAVPGSGVYAVRARLGAVVWPAVANIGVRPTFETEPVAPRVEAHILDFEEDIYGRQLGLEFVERLRPEMKFPGPEALVAQIHADIEKARQILA